MSQSTASVIIQNGLKRAGNPSIEVEMRTYLNDFLDRLYEDRKWEFLEKSTSGTAAIGATAISLPTDFVDIWDEHGLRVEDADGKLIPLTIISQDEFDTILDPDDTAELPLVAVFNLNAMTWQPWPVPTTAVTWHLRYRYKPSRISDFDNEKPVFPNDMILEQYVFAYALQWEDDDRAPAELNRLVGLIDAFKQGKNISHLKPKRMALSPKVFKPIVAYR